MTLKTPSLRYYARFKGEAGHLRAIVRYDNIRKCIKTPLVITRSQLPKLDTQGLLTIAPGNTSDALLHGRLKEYTSIVWRVVNPLIRSGRFATMSGKELTAAINEARTEAEKEGYKRTMAMQGLKVEAMPEEAFQSGWHYANGRPMSAEDSAALDAFSSGWRYTDGRPMSAEDIAKVKAILRRGPMSPYEGEQQGKEDDHEK